MDTRTERTLRDGNVPSNYALAGEEQLQALETWLSDAADHSPDLPKFIFSGSTLVPLDGSFLDCPETWRLQDGWAGYPDTLERVLSYIAKENVQHVVFVGGDAHLSAFGRLKIRTAEGEIIAWQLAHIRALCAATVCQRRRAQSPLGKGTGLPGSMSTQPCCRIRCDNAVRCALTIHESRMGESIYSRHGNERLDGGLWIGRRALTWGKADTTSPER
ncbi:MAG: alkaline phosphatase D family protein [Gammaproteobacteria bacterium]|nr:alkaline phosphatase D family protein [Gammaproteobacteria bacterium]